LALQQQDGGLLRAYWGRDFRVKLAHIFQAADFVAAELAALAVEPELESAQHDEPQPEGVAMMAPEEGVPPAAGAR
jgi:hypothetical protein